MKTQTIPAYAKLNLTLDILGKRDDGYHELRMVMQTVSLHDDVTVTLTDGTGVACRVAGAELPCDERNLAVKAANAFCEIIEDAGYDAMIYITDYAGYVKYDLSKVMDYPLWYARYDVSAPTFYYDFAMWQYSSKGSVLSLIHI